MIYEQTIELTRLSDGESGQSNFIHIKYSNDGISFTSNDGEDIGTWIGIYTDSNEEDSMEFGKYQWTKFVGQDGKDGTSVTIKGSYSLSEWETIKTELAATAVAGDAYLVDGNLYVFSGTEFTNCGRIQGNGISSATVSYQVSDSGTDIPTGTWSETIPEADAGQYLWTKTEINYDDGTNTTMYGVSAMGKNGRQYELDIVSSNGNIFKNGNINTTLSAVLYEYGEVVTDNYNENCFIWTRTSSDIEGDKIWNSSHAGGSKSIEITSSDVFGKAVFSCDFIDTTTRESLL